RPRPHHRGHLQPRRPGALPARPRPRPPQIRNAGRPLPRGRRQPPRDAHTTATKAANAARDTPEPLSAAERQDLQAEIAYLRTFSDVCRTHLRAYLESLTRSIDEWETPSTTAPSP